MNEINYEAQHKEEYYQKVVQGLDALLESIKTVQLEAPDYEMISGKATGEVDAYVRQNLIRPLADAKARILQELQADSEPAVQGNEPKRFVKGNTQRAMLFYKPLQDIFSSLKEVPYLSPQHYEQIIRQNTDVVEVLTDFINQIDSGRQRRLRKI